MLEVVTCHVLKITYDTLMKQPADWVDWTMQLHKIMNEEEKRKSDQDKTINELGNDELLM